MTNPDLPQFMQFWNFQDPAGTEEKFQAVLEETGEVLLATEDAAEAQPYFQQAFMELQNVDWVKDSDPGRIERLKKLGAGE